MARKPVVSALPALKPTRIANTATGEIITWESFLAASLAPLTEWVHTETQRLYDQNPSRVQKVAAGLKFSPAEHARKNGFAIDSDSLPRAAKVKSRINKLVGYKLMSEVAAYARNSDPRKKEPRFSRTLNLGAVDRSMAILEREEGGNTLILTWKCWESEYELTFAIPHYTLQRDITKFSLPLVSLRGFIFTVQESPSAAIGKNVAGVDLGRVEPFTMAVLGDRGNMLAELRARPQTRATNNKRERILAEVASTRKKANAYDALGLDDSVLRQEVRRMRNKSARMGLSLKNEIAADIVRKSARHDVSLLLIEGLRWAAGSKYGSKWNHGDVSNKIEHTAARYGIKTKRVSARNTSQNCHGCSAKIVHRTKNRTVWCKECKTILDRDVNAALNVAKNKGIRLPLGGRADHAVGAEAPGVLANEPVLAECVT